MLSTIKPPPGGEDPDISQPYLHYAISGTDLR